MRRVILVLFLAHFSLTSFCQIIANHIVVDKYDKIPEQYINEVKKMWLVVAGESHSAAIRGGLTLLKAINPNYTVNETSSGNPEAYTNSHLRVSGATWGDYSNSAGWMYWYGEEDWYTNSIAIARTKAGISYCNLIGLTISAIGLGWCADMTEGVGTANADPVYGCHWYGNSLYGPDGDKPWGVDASNYTTTANSINMNTYLTVTQNYNDYCTENGIPTKVFFSTGPVDADNSWYGEKAYQGNLKHNRIRDYVKADPSRILFDYADILCYDDDGTPATSTWNGHTFPIITSTNVSPVQIGHISNAGAIRLAKAMWWMLARIAGWDGITTSVQETESQGLLSVIVDNYSQEIKIHLESSYLFGQISLYNLLGFSVENKKIDSVNCTFNKSDLYPGIYFIVATKSNVKGVKKIVVLN